MWLDVLAVMAGGALGAAARYMVLLSVQPQQNGMIPWGTLTANLLGSLLIGFLAALFVKVDMAQSWRLFLVIGILSSFTTFSTFSLETIQLWREGFYLNALLYVLLSNFGGIALAAAGYFLMAGGR